MSNLKPLVCPNCGGKINRQRMKCEYCGTEFKRDEGPQMIIETVHRGVQTAGVSVIVPEYHLHRFDEEEIRHIVGDELTCKLAEALVPLLDLEVSRDALSQDLVVRGRIRVLEPGYRF